MLKDHNEPCLNNIECNLVKGLLCANNKCACPNSKFYNFVSDNCGNEEFFDFNIINNKSLINVLFSELQKDYDQQCINNIECKSAEGHICTDNKCSCPNGKNYDIKNLKCGK